MINATNRNLDQELAKHIAKELEAFQQAAGDKAPGDLTHDEWHIILNKMIRGFQVAAEGTYYRHRDEEEMLDEALSLFAKWYHALWI